ncbi:MAG: 3-methyl-2-oxobutanoate hydroxymethyltransferase [Planctomycetota bacterium]|nr:3-methyl-2-oxobutanoate hydroxymethyltransferase [Planctomycetota bacterium]
MSRPSTPGNSPEALSKVTTPGLRARKLAGVRISALTAYDYPTALIVEEAGIDVVLVGDSLANVVLGYENTLPVSVEEMLAALRAVGRGVRRALLVADMPFGSYHVGEEKALEAAVNFIKAGAEAVKLEGGSSRAPLVRRLVENGIPVMGHIGLTPQSIHVMGGYKVQGKGPEASRELVEAALALERAGAFSIVLEGIPAPLARELTGRLEIPTIGIGAGPDCDGQILVLADLLGLVPGRKPKFVRRYVNLFEQAVEAVHAYRRDVLDGQFPSAEESYGMKPRTIAKA